MSGGGGNEPNLTPFIDLFSVLICFLLMTAAWLSLETLQTTVSAKDVPSSSDSTPPPEDKPDDEKKVKLSVEMFADRVVLKEDDKEKVFPNAAAGFDTANIKQELAQWRQAFPKKKDLVLNTDAQVKYGQLISMYDLLIAADWPDVGISPK